MECCQHGRLILRDEGDVGRGREVEQYQGVTKQVLRGVEFGHLPLCVCEGSGRGRAMARGSGREEHKCVSGFVFLCLNALAEHCGGRGRGG